MGSRVKIAALLLLVLFSLQAGCISLGPPPPRGGPVTQVSTPATSAGDGSIQDITSRVPPRVALADAVGAIPAAEQEGTIDTTGMVITKVWGYGVDSAGRARTWVLGMQGGGRTGLFSYNEGEYQALDLPTPLPEEEVKLAELLSPQDLFARNLRPISAEMSRLKVGECDLTLEKGVYQVIIHSASESGTLSFDAKTGEGIPSP